MNKQKALTYITLALIALNIVALGFFFLKKPPHKRPQLPKEYIIQTLNFDKEQISEYEKLIAAHQGAIQKLNKQLQADKNILYKQLTETNPNTDSIIQEIGNSQLEIEQLHIAHFRDVKSLCKPEQMNDFNKLTSELARLFAPHKPKRRK